ncbi:uncharacterized protein A4U43_C07F37980 [Asparagus officinalis]|uniref:Uncharacterized protein n=1 Tax=Asparagus officinalis TaxID=4686 RepID=A0A5P1EIE8_ASPOF|nr:uncharacterized protein A4U43_C07F37980 [Asparagus officinalis]
MHTCQVQPVFESDDNGKMQSFYILEDYVDRGLTKLIRPLCNAHLLNLQRGGLLMVRNMRKKMKSALRYIFLKRIPRREAPYRSLVFDMFLKCMILCYCSVLIHAALGY